VDLKNLSEEPEDSEAFEGDGDTDETEEVLNEAVDLLEDCHALLDALTAPGRNKKTEAYFKREIVKVADEIHAFLNEHWDGPKEED
jgi:hypothetical protein